VKKSYSFIGQATKLFEKDGNFMTEAIDQPSPTKQNRYSQIVEHVFLHHFQEGARVVEFTRVISDGGIALWSFGRQNGVIKILEEKHYRLTAADAIAPDDLVSYRATGNVERLAGRSSCIGAV
jgi:hypothetical protein